MASDLVRCLPPIVRNPRWTRSRASNSYWRIVYNPAIDGLGGTLCQERCEMGWKWKHPIRYRTKGGKQDMEILGHAVEIAYNADRGIVPYDQGVRDEAWALTFYPQFSGVSWEDIMDRLRDATPRALRWLAGHAGFVCWARAQELKEARVQPAGLLP